MSFLNYQLSAERRALTDSAFVDRADIAQYIDYPPPEAVYEILRSTLVELMARGIVAETVCSGKHQHAMILPLLTPLRRMCLRPRQLG